MKKFEVAELRSSSVWTLYRMREKIQADPDYQRQGEVWTPDKRQLLIDTLINGFDIPKIYLHKFEKTKTIDGKNYDYAIIDGRQRLETMWAYISGVFPLASDFEYFSSQAVNAQGMTYQDLAKEYPDVKTDFDNFQLNVITVETEDVELIEEMFSRLNEAVPLTAAEKRNAWGGPVPKAIRELAGVPFFTQNLPFKNKRYKHYDLALKFLISQDRNAVVDTKKAYLDRYVKDRESESKNKKIPAVAASKVTLDNMANVFSEADPLLRSIGMVSLYYHLFRVALNEGWASKITRQALSSFEKKRQLNREVAEKNLPSADYDLIEFDRYAQSSNDLYAVKFRLQVLLRHITSKHYAIEDL